MELWLKNRSSWLEAEEEVADAVVGQDGENPVIRWKKKKHWEPKSSEWLREN